MVDLSWEQRDGARDIVRLACCLSGASAPVVARARYDGRFRHAGVLERDRWIERRNARAKINSAESYEILIFLEKFLFRGTIRGPELPLVIDEDCILRTYFGDYLSVILDGHLQVRVAFARFEDLPPYGRLCSNRAMWRSALSILETASRIVGDTNAEIRACSRYIISQEDHNFLRDFNVFSVTTRPKGPLFSARASLFWEALAGDPWMRFVFIEYRNYYEIIAMAALNFLLL